MAVINTNIAATITSNALAKNERAMGQTMERLSTGQRINSAADDAAGLAISSKMTSQIRGLDQAVRNGNDAISMIQTADGAAIEISNMLQRMRELSVQAATGTNGTTDISALNTEFTALRDQIEKIADNTEWNGAKILNSDGGASGTFTFQVGANASQIQTVAFGDFNLGGAVLGINLASGSTLTADLVFPVTGATPANALLKTLPDVLIDASGRAVVDGWLRPSPAHPSLYALGDAVAVGDAMTVVAVMRQEPWLRKALKSVLDGKQVQELPCYAPWPLAPILLPLGPTQGASALPVTSGGLAVGAFLTSMIKGKTLFIPRYRKEFGYA